MREELAMFSIQRLLGEEGKFFPLLEASAEQACQSVTYLKEFLSKPQERSLRGFATTRRQEKAISHEISASLCRSFVTPMEPEDIEAISYSLYRIPKTVEKFGEHAMVFGKKLSENQFTTQLELLEQATSIVREMVKALGRKPKIRHMKDLGERLGAVEGAADKLMIDLLREIYSGRTDPVSAIALRDLYELLEKAIDRCRDAGNAIFRVVLKSS